MRPKYLCGSAENSVRDADHDLALTSGLDIGQGVRCMNKKE